ncbi:MAG: LytR C-terminal domain-containing protein [bacterium]|nr:LytR C-terminal domain-containing protein [bacterium]
MNPNRQSTNLPDNADDLFDDELSPTSQSALRFRRGLSRRIFVLIGFCIVFLILVLSLLLFLKTRGPKTLTPAQPPIVQTLPEDVRRATPIPTTSAEPMDVSTLRVRVLNGSGIPGEAWKVKSVLEENGFAGVEATNAASFDMTNTEIRTKSTAAKAVVDRIIKLLVGRTVTTGGKLDDTALIDVEIIVGP